MALNSYSLSSFHYTKEKNFFLPITEIVESFSKNAPLSQDNLIFCYKVVLATLTSLIEKRYSDFDAITTTNCCHGISLFARELICMLLKVDVKTLCAECRQRIEELKNGPKDQVRSTLLIPQSLMDLTSLYILGFVKESDHGRGGRTNKTKLKQISPLGTKICDRLIDGLQKRYANIIALKYHQYLDHFDEDFVINGLPVTSWGKYVDPKYLRIDSFGTRYASNLYSMQVTVAYLIKTKAKIAIVNDIFGQKGTLRERYVALLKGNGVNGFNLLSKKDIQGIPFSEPVIVMGGCAYSDLLDEKEFHATMHHWLSQLPSLVLACDIFYPQFPKASRDPQFNSSPIEPLEEEIKKLLNHFSQYQGFSSLDPSLFCLSHIYPASIKEILNLVCKKTEKSLPLSYIPLSRLSEKVINEFQLS